MHNRCITGVNWGRHAGGLGTSCGRQNWSKLLCSQGLCCASQSTRHPPARRNDGPPGGRLPEPRRTGRPDRRGGTTKAAGGRNAVRGQLARAGAGHGAASQGPRAADSAYGDDGATRVTPKAKVTGSGIQRQRATDRAAARQPGTGPGATGRTAARRNGTGAQDRETEQPQGQLGLRTTGPRGGTAARQVRTQVPPEAAGHAARRSRRQPGTERQGSRKAGRQAGPTGPGRAPPQGGRRPGPGTRSAGHPQGQPARRVHAGPEGQGRVARPIWGTGTVARPLPSPTWKGPRPMFGVAGTRVGQRHAHAVVRLVTR
ncbi:MAG: hypothetical protein JWO22_237 [Frankiales bacterium]|nr:hypothetical protein [Frankiales bacterium]